MRGTEQLGAFLHSEAWEAFLGSTGQKTERAPEGLYVRGVLPNKATYWRTSRVVVDSAWQPPAFTKKAWFIRLEPFSELPKEVSRFGVVRPTESIQPKQTVVLDLAQPAEKVLESMKSKHRYNIRLAERYGVQVELVHEDAAEHFTRFWSLLSHTATRQKFRTHDKDYYQKMIETLAPRGLAHLGFAKLDGKDLATVLLITNDKTITYLHGGSSEARKEVMAPFALHWQIIQWAQSVGCEAYDLWGTNAVQNEGGWEPRANHPSSGTTRFKLGFGGTVVQYPGAFDLVLKPIPYTLYNGIRRIIRRQSSF